MRKRRTHRRADRWGSADAAGHTSRFDPGALFIWALVTLAFAVWFVIYALQEFRPAV